MHSLFIYINWSFNMAMWFYAQLGDDHFTLCVTFQGSYTAIT